MSILADIAVYLFIFAWAWLPAVLLAAVGKAADDGAVSGQVFAAVTASTPALAVALLFSAVKFMD